MKRTLFILVYIISSFCFVSLAQNFSTKSDIAIVESSEEGMTLKFSLNDYRFDEVETPQGTAYVPVLLNSGSNTEKGAPNLPTVMASILIPNQGGLEVQVRSSDYDTMPDISIAPSKGVIFRNQNPADVPYVYGDAYQTNRFLPETLCTTDEPYIMHNVRGSNIEFRPFVYNAVSKELRIYKEIVIEVKYTRHQSVNEIINPKKSNSTDGEFNTIYNRLFLNASDGAKYTPLEEVTPGKLLVVVADKYADAMPEYVSWKREKGIDTEMVLASEIASPLTSTNLKAYIQDKYDNDENLCYILLVGDGADIPTKITNNYGDSDYHYACLNGSDGYADAFIGRFSGNTIEDIKTQVQRTIHYEKSLNSDDTWLATGFGSASNEGAGGGHYGESDAQHMNKIKDKLEGYGYTVTSVYQNGGSNSKIAEAMNEGVSIANYIGHGDTQLWVNTYFTNSNVNALVNEYKLPFIWSVACVNGDFRNNTCFAEAWLRATNNGNPTGAVAFLGSTINQSWVEPMHAQDEMVDILVESYTDNIKRTMGGLSFNGMFLMIQKGGMGQQMADTWVLFGDPSLAVRTDVPAAMNISYNDIIILGENTFDIECDTENALACLSFEDEEGIKQIAGYAYVTDGVASIPVTAEEPAIYTLTLTAFNRETIQEEISVIVSDGAYIVKGGYDIDDSEGGNGDGRIDYGERISINQSLKNVGIADATDVTISITLDNEDIVMEKDNASIDRIEVQSIVEIEEAFILEIPKDIEDGTSVSVSLAITDGEDNVWNTNYKLDVHAPQISITATTVDDTIDGNGDRLMNSGETVKAIISLINHGSASIRGNATLSFDDTYVTITTNNVPVTTTNESSEIGDDETATLEFEIVVSDNVPQELEEICFELYLDAIDKSYVICYPINISVENWESADFFTYIWDNTSDIPWTVVSDEKYEGAYSAKSGAIGNKGKTTLSVTLDVLADSKIEFYKKVSCEKSTTSSSGKETFYDNLAFYIDNEVVGRWGGEIDWSLESYEINAGEHEFRWEYSKDMSIKDGQDCAWIDWIRFPKHQAPVSIDTITTGKEGTNVYPNPSNGQFKIEVKEPARMKMTDLTGRMVYETNLTGGVNNIASSLPEGVYLIIISTNNTTQSSKMVIKR